MSKAKKIPTEVTLPIKWNIPDNIITRFASNMVVQTLENEFKISFFEMKPDIIFDVKTQIPTEVKADCVASLIITADRLTKFVELLQTQLQSHKQNTQKNRSL